MRRLKRSYVLLIVAVLAAILVPLYIFFPSGRMERDSPWDKLPQKITHTDHTALMKGPFNDGPSVTRTCLQCHKDAATQVMHTAHWTWESPAVTLPSHPKPVVLGKKHAINNFCIGITGNWPPCTACHAGYGWEDASFDFSNPENVDCLVCHDRSGQYAKANAGYPAEGVDLVKAAQSVALPNRANCGGCHFRGGGGNAVKHGDLDESLYYPDENLDVHMGKYNFQCIDCHRTEKHDIKGRAISVSVDGHNQVYCTDCHSKTLHKDERINAHIQTVACQTCHIPFEAIKTPTKTHWDWSTAGKDLPQNVHTYLKIKGSFIYERKIIPAYTWYNEKADHYVLGDKINPADTVNIDHPLGDINDPTARIWPFKIHLAKQIYDTKNDWLIQPKTFGEGGFWTEFNWDKAARLGSEAVGIPYSGHYGFTDTRMYWPTTHMVAEKEKALQCVDCHVKSGQGRMDWNKLGYDGDPMFYGNRFKNNGKELGYGRNN